ncbi:uncharacterized protein KY384_007423 [Bacidia gigantensis]|uniref:uncharacterized protein n=1 Tax=Bacidia gigantensis TaxID=2732470 RepID=UPI001D0569FD|nr:uncharacterized protein KY384_007423 [Bacidia gigantensis]KAG8528505.1 hypothetical protein KY384_007423 [Bacidia gigantensis]
MALRFFLGAFEAAYAPGIIYLLSFFYLRNEVGLRCGLFASAAPIASTFAGALAYGVLHGHSSLRNWRLLFLVEGLPTILMVPFAFFFIPDSPSKARFLNSKEKAIVRSRAVRQTGTVDRLGSLSLGELACSLSADSEADNQGSDSRRGAGLVLINVVGQCGPVLGTRLYPKSQAPRFVKGMSICAAFMFWTFFMAVALRFLLVWENKKLDRQYPKSKDEKEPGQDAIAAENYGPSFRYVL